MMNRLPVTLALIVLFGIVIPLWVDPSGIVPVLLVLALFGIPAAAIVGIVLAVRLVGLLRLKTASLNRLPIGTPHASDGTTASTVARAKESIE